jgi:hypothetical protein
MPWQPSQPVYQESRPATPYVAEPIQSRQVEYPIPEHKLARSIRRNHRQQVHLLY